MSENIEVYVPDGPVTDPDRKGFHASLHLDPEDEDISLHVMYGTGTTFGVWHHRVLEFSVPACTSGSHLRELLEEDEVQGMLREILDTYEGTRWDGQNNIGMWEHSDDEGVFKYEANKAEIERRIEMLPVFCGASDAIGCAWSDFRENVLEAIVSSPDEESEEQKLSDAATELVDEFEGQGVLLDMEDVEGRIRDAVSELEADKEEEDFMDLFLVEPAKGSSRSLSRFSRDQISEAVRRMGTDCWLVESDTPVSAGRAARGIVAKGKSEAIAHALGLLDQWSYHDEEGEDLSEWLSGELSRAHGPADAIQQEAV